MNEASSSAVGWTKIASGGMAAPDGTAISSYCGSHLDRLRLRLRHDRLRGWSLVSGV